MAKIDVAMGTIGRNVQFQKTLESLNDTTNAHELALLIMDGNEGDAIQSIIDSKKWKFESIRLFDESTTIPQAKRGKWPSLYNYLFKQGNSPFVTFWSDDVFPHKDCFEIGIRKFNDGKNVGAVAFAWSDGNNENYKIYGTEMHKQTMVNFGLIRRSILESVGYIDEDYKFYNADQDLSLKIWYKGFKVVRENRSKVIHYSGRKANNSYRSGECYAEDSKLFTSKWAYQKVKRRTVKI